MSGKGDKKKRQDFDKRIKAKGEDSLNLIYDQYEKTLGPDNFFQKTIDNMSSDINAQKSDAMESFQQMQKQEQQKFQMQQAQGQRSYGEMQRTSEMQMEQSREQAQLEAVEARSTGAEGAYEMMAGTGSSGMAGTGGRARKTLAGQAQRGMAKINLSLSQQMEQADEALRGADIERQQGMSSAALGLQQNVDSQELALNQQRDTLDRQMQTEMDKVLNEQDQKLDSLRKEASTVVQSTITSFTDASSSWDVDWASHLDGIDTEYGEGDG